MCVCVCVYVMGVTGAYCIMMIILYIIMYADTITITDKVCVGQCFAP